MPFEKSLIIITYGHGWVKQNVVLTIGQILNGMSHFLSSCANTDRESAFPCVGCIYSKLVLLSHDHLVQLRQPNLRWVKDVNSDSLPSRVHFRVQYMNGVGSNFLWAIGDPSDSSLNFRFSVRNHSTIGIVQLDADFLH